MPPRKARRKRILGEGKTEAGANILQGDQQPQQHHDAPPQQLQQHQDAPPQGDQRLQQHQGAPPQGDEQLQQHRDARPQGDQRLQQQGAPPEGDQQLHVASFTGHIVQRVPDILFEPVGFVRGPAFVRDGTLFAGVDLLTGEAQLVVRGKSPMSAPMFTSVDTLCLAFFCLRGVAITLRGCTTPPFVTMHKLEEFTATVSPQQLSKRVMRRFLAGVRCFVDFARLAVSPAAADIEYAPSRSECLFVAGVRVPDPSPPRLAAASLVRVPTRPPRRRSDRTTPHGGDTERSKQQKQAKQKEKEAKEKKKEARQKKKEAKQENKEAKQKKEDGQAAKELDKSAKAIAKRQKKEAKKVEKKKDAKKAKKTVAAPRKEKLDTKKTKPKSKVRNQADQKEADAKKAADASRKRKARGQAVLEEVTDGLAGSSPQKKAAKKRAAQYLTTCKATDDQQDIIEALQRATGTPTITDIHKAMVPAMAPAMCKLCKSELEREAKFCGSCGATTSCAKCGSEVKSRFCVRCGTDSSPPVPPFVPPFVSFVPLEQTDGQTNRPANRRTERQTDRQTDKQTYTQRDRRTDARSPSRHQSRSRSRSRDCESRRASRSRSRDRFRRAARARSRDRGRGDRGHESRRASRSRSRSRDRGRDDRSMDLPSVFAGLIALGKATSTAGIPR